MAHDGIKPLRYARYLYAVTMTEETVEKVASKIKLAVTDACVGDLWRGVWGRPKDVPNCFL